MVSRILLVRFSALGDVIQTIPILSMLRQAAPDATIGWLVDEELAPVLEGHPHLTHLHPCPRRRWVRSLRNPLQWWSTIKEVRAFIRQLQAIDYEVGIDVQGLFKTALMLYLTGIRRRIGYTRGRECSSIFYNETYDCLGQDFFNPAVPHLEHMRVLIQPVANVRSIEPSIDMPPVLPAEREKVTALLAEGFASQEPVIAVAPATQWPSKHWPVEHWVRLLNDILAQTRLNIVMVGSSKDAPLSARIVSQLPPDLAEGRVLDLTGKTSARELAALFAGVAVAIGSDSAPLHMAGAMHVPHLIGLFGPTSYRRTAPIGSPRVTLHSTEGTLDCQPCHKGVCPLGTNDCMKKITPEAVLNDIVNV